MIVRHSFATRIGKIVDINGVPHKVVRQVFWKKAVVGHPEWFPRPWTYFYYEVKPVEKTTSKETVREENNSGETGKTPSSTSS